MNVVRGVGIAAPQIGIPLSFFIYLDKVCINPTISDCSPEENIKEEGCLSLPGQSFQVSRPNSVVVHYYNEKLQLCLYKLEGDECRIFLHEFDHLQGLLINRWSNPQKNYFIPPEKERRIRRQYINKYGVKNNANADNSLGTPWWWQKHVGS